MLVDVLMVVRDAPLAGGVERALCRSAEPLRLEGFEVRALVVPYHAPGQAADALGASMPVTRAMPAEAKAYLARAAIVHIHAQDCLAWPKPVLWHARRAQRPVMLTVHLPSYPPRGSWSPGRVRVSATIGALGLALASAGASAFAPSADAATDAQRRFGPWLQFGVMRNGAPDPGVARIPSGPLRVAFVGRLEPHKEPHVFIESIRLARESGADVFADVIGDGYLRPELEQRVITAGLADRIRFHGWLTDPNRLMAQASLIAMTSRHEGASLVVLEAGALGKGVVAREGLEGLRHDWPGAIYRVAAHAGATEFAAAFADLAARPDAIVALGSAARSAYEGGFTLQQSAREWAAMYRRAVG